MAVTAVSALPAIPAWRNVEVVTGKGTGTINPGDWLMYSGQHVLASYSGLASTAYWKASGAGIALEGSPVYTPAGRTAINTGLKILRQGIVRVSGAQSGSPTLGLGALPISSGSGIAAPTGATGSAATWTAVAPRPASGLTAATPYIGPVAFIIGTDLNGGQTAQLDLLLVPGVPGLY